MGHWRDGLVGKSACCVNIRILTLNIKQILKKLDMAPCNFDLAL